jgi:hypothetical protein
MAKIPITVAIEKEELQCLIKIARETHQTVQSLIRTLINKQLKKFENGNKQNGTY